MHRYLRFMILGLAAPLLLGLWLAPSMQRGFQTAPRRTHVATTTTAAAGSSGFSSCAIWRVMSGANPSGALADELYGVAAISANDVWGVGYWGTSLSAPDNPLIEQYNGSVWNVVPGPTPSNFQGGHLNAVAATSAQDVWAVGVYYNTALNASVTLIEHYNGTAWNIIPSPNPSSTGGSLLSVSADASNDVWAAGYNISTAGHFSTLVEHYDGTSWSIVPSPNVSGSSGPVDNLLVSVSAVSNTSVWAVGSEGNYSSSQFATLIERWDGTSWSIVPSLNGSLVNSQLNGVAARSSTDVMAVGETADAEYSTQFPFAEQWNGTTWAAVKVPSIYPNYAPLTAVTDVPASDQAWAAGEMFTGSSRITLTDRWMGSSWADELSPSGPSAENYLYAVSADSTSDAWAVGTYDPNLPAALQYQSWGAAHRLSATALRPGGPYGGAPGSAILILHYHTGSVPSAHPCPQGGGSGSCNCG